MERILTKAQIKIQIGRLESNADVINNEVLFIAKSFFNYYLSQYESTLTDIAILDIFEEDISNTFRAEIVTAFLLLPVMKDFYDKAEEVKDKQYEILKAKNAKPKPKAKPTSTFNSTVSSRRDTSSYSSSSSYCGSSSSSSPSRSC